ncbi:MAG TPA: PepSY-associated TM helix domain-containing protein [Bryobacteraceae bacterium]|nr:PepSY-associated TM helix domain-containing protein [Bryobacteraceae bacterium]
MSLRKALFWTHLAAGCVAGIVILVMSVTGVLLAYERQITAWVDRGFRSAPPSPGTNRLPIETLLENVATRNPGLPSAITVRSDPAAPAEVGFGRDHVFLVDVYTGDVLGESSPGARSFFQKVENWHRWLGASNDHRAAGRAITGACNFAFLILVVTGPFLWMPRRWSWQNIKNISLFRGGLSGKARDFNWHNVTGIWCAVPLFLIVLSGVVMSYPWANNLLYRLTGSQAPVPSEAGQRQTKQGGRPRQGERARRGEPAPANAAGLNLLWGRAEQQVPGWRSVTLRFPPSGQGPMTFAIDTGNGGRPDQRSQLTLDARTGDIVRWEPFASYNAGRRLRGWFRFLHTGEAGGIAGQTIAGIASAGGALLVWTGLWLAARRLLRWKKRSRLAPESADKNQAMTVSS